MNTAYNIGYRLGGTTKTASSGPDADNQLLALQKAGEQGRLSRRAAGLVGSVLGGIGGVGIGGMTGAGLGLHIGDGTPASGGYGALGGAVGGGALGAYTGNRIAQALHSFFEPAGDYVAGKQE